MLRGFTKSHTLCGLRVIKHDVTSVVDSTEVLCPLFDEIEILIHVDSPSIFPSLDKI